MRPRAPIRPDIHARFITVVARAEAKLRDEEKAIERTLAAPLARDTDADNDDDGEPSRVAESAPPTTPSRRE